MKTGKTALNIISFFIKKSIRKRRKKYPPHSFREKINIPYIDDGSIYHKYDVYLANEENRKHVCIFDIHGGSYLFGEHQDNYPLAYEFIKEGYDVVLVDYAPNDGNRDIYDIANECVSCINHVLDRKKEYVLDNDSFVFMGDSAGGHLAILMSMIYTNKELAKKLQLSPLPIDLRMVLVNSPVYDYVDAYSSLSSSGARRMIGPKWKDKEHQALYSPNCHIDLLKLPIFVSTCKRDFIRSQTLHLMDDIKGRDNVFFIDINSDNKAVDHVHNVTKPHLKESIEVNKAMLRFIEEYINDNK